MVKETQIRNLQVGLRVWSGGEIFGKKIKTLWGGHNVPPLIITKVNVTLASNT